MKYRALGTTGLTVSEIGFGAWGIGGVSKGATSYGATDDQESLRALQRALELGITFYDTSDLYGYGHSEELIGQAFAGKRDNVVIASKVGFLEHKGPHDLSEAHIRRSLQGTLKRLRTDYLDLYQLHSPPLSAIKENNAIAILEALKHEGSIRAYGISVQSPDDGIPAIRDFGFLSVQVNFNLADQRARENGLLSYAHDAGAGIIVRTPLCFGFLTGKYHGAQFDERDHRATWPKKQRERWASAADAYRAMYEKKRLSPALFALQFCLSTQGASTAIPGMLTAAQVEENARASDAPPLAPEELEMAQKIYRAHDTFFEPGAKPLNIYATAE